MILSRPPGLSVRSTPISQHHRVWSENGSIEFRAGFSLRSDHHLRSFTVKVGADAGPSDDERELLLIMVFDEIEEQIDLAIADNMVSAN